MSDIKVLEKKAMDLPGQAKTIKVTDQASLTRANNALLYIKDLRKEIRSTFEPIATKQYAAYKETKKQWKKHQDPLDEAKDYLDPQVGDYLAEQKRIRIEAEEKAIKEKAEAERKQKELEEKKLQEALAAEEAGNKEKAERILEEIPVPVQPLVSPAPIRKPQTEGIHEREYWKWEVVDITKVPREYLRVDERKVKLEVDALKKETNIPGIRVFTKSIIVTRESNAPS